MRVKNPVILCGFYPFNQQSGYISTKDEILSIYKNELNKFVINYSLNLFKGWQVVHFSEIDFFSRQGHNFFELKVSDEKNKLTRFIIIDFSFDGEELILRTLRNQHIELNTFESEKSFVDFFDHSIGDPNYWGGKTIFRKIPPPDTRTAEEKAAGTAAFLLWLLGGVSDSNSQTNKCNCSSCGGFGQITTNRGGETFKENCNKCNGSGRQSCN